MVVLLLLVLVLALVLVLETIITIIIMIIIIILRFVSLTPALILPSAWALLHNSAPLRAPLQPRLGDLREAAAAASTAYGTAPRHRHCCTMAQYCPKALTCPKQCLFTAARSARRVKNSSYIIENENNHDNNNNDNAQKNNNNNNNDSNHKMGSENIENYRRLLAENCFTAVVNARERTPASPFNTRADVGRHSPQFPGRHHSSNLRLTFVTRHLTMLPSSSFSKVSQ